MPSGRKENIRSAPCQAIKPKNITKTGIIKNLNLLRSAKDNILGYKRMITSITINTKPIILRVNIRLERLEFSAPRGNQYLDKNHKTRMETMPMFM